jgi:hypothetical protein
MEVIEVSSPAEHETKVDHDMQLPNSEVHCDRDFGGQHFVRHQSRKANWFPGPYDGFEARDTGIGDATKGLASVLVLRPTDHVHPVAISGDAEFVFNFVLRGSLSLQHGDDAPQEIVAGDSFVISPGMPATIVDHSDDLELLHVTSNQRSD